MTTRRTRRIRFFAGLALLLAILIPVFIFLPRYTQTWGSTAEERARVLPGDDILPDPILTWNHGITIDAPPGKVWPWIAQLGDDRGGFYSYTFIENLIAGEDLYNNANEVILAYQNPQPGEGMIDDFLTVREVATGEYLMAHLAGIPEVGWTWLWYIEPAAEGQTRLIMRMKIQPGPELNMDPAFYVIDLSGFVMERRMMTGIRDRAEGRFDPPGIEALEIGLWVVALLAGIIAAGLFRRRQAWPVPLLIAVLSVLALLVFTFMQPPIWIRALVDVILLAGLIFFARATRPPTREILEWAK
jgi:hypothetical protein